MKYDIKDLSIEEKIGQMTLIGLNTKTSLEKLEEIIVDYKVGGILIYKKNYSDYSEMIELINRIKYLNQKNKIPIFIAIDQEGGRVNRFPNEFKNIPSANKLAKNSQKKNLVKIAGNITGKTLNKLGINMNFAPVLDIKRFKDNHAIGDRAYSENIEEVSKYGIDYIKRLQENKVVSVVKHFPGHGATMYDSHFKIPKIRKNLKELENEDMIPFKNAIENKVDGILVGHLKLHNYITSEPVSMSKQFVAKYLRKKYRYNGLIITDDMRMKAVKYRYGKNRAIKKAFLSCNDIIVFKYDSDINVLKKIVEMAKKGKIEEKYINRSVLRILKTKEKYDINDNVINKDENVIHEINEEIEEIRKQVF